jgi:hypothetical protein
MIFPPFLGGSRNSRKNGFRSVLANYFRELNKPPDLISNLKLGDTVGIFAGTAYVRLTYHSAKFTGFLLQKNEFVLSPKRVEDLYKIITLIACYFTQYKQT